MSVLSMEGSMNKMRHGLRKEVRKCYSLQNCKQNFLIKKYSFFLILFVCYDIVVFFFHSCNFCIIEKYILIITIEINKQKIIKK